MSCCGALCAIRSEATANAEVRDEKGNTLLHYMAGYGRANFLPMLLETGLKDLLNDKNMEDQTPLDVARVNLQAEKVADMCEGCSGGTTCLTLLV